MTRDELLNTPLREADDTQHLPNGALTNTMEVEDLLDLAANTGRAQDFIADVYDFWMEKGFITQTQANKLQEIIGYM